MFYDTFKCEQHRGTKEQCHQICRYTHMDEKLSFKEHITAKCRTAANNFQQIKAIQQVLTEQAMETLVLGTVMSHLDYCNAILCDLPNTDIS